MNFAGHCPTEHFSLAEWSAMPEFDDSGEGNLPPAGWSRQRDSRGAAICVFFNEQNWRASFAVRPIVRVRAPYRMYTAPIPDNARPGDMLTGNRGARAIVRELRASEEARALYLEWVPS